MSDDSTFRVDDEFEYGGVKYRTRRGNRCQGDMVIEFNTGGGWHRPTIVHSLILLQFKAQVEDNNYPEQEGRFKLLRAVQSAIMGINGYGWRDVAQKIECEVNRKKWRSIA